jgi:hypothetical protein
MLETQPAPTDFDLITLQRAMPDTRMRRGTRIPSWYLLLVSVFGFLSSCQSLRNLERFANLYHTALTKALGIEIKRSPSDTAFRYFFLQMDVTVLCAAIGDWTIVQILDDAEALDQLVCDTIAMLSSIQATSSGISKFIALLTLYSAAMGVAISQACYTNGENHERFVP